MEKKINGSENLLIIQLKPLGDILLTTPVAEYLKTKFSGIRITFIVYEEYSGVLKNNPFIDEVVQMKDLPKRNPDELIDYILHRIEVIKDLRSRDFDIVIDYIGLPSTAIMSFFTQAPLRIAYKKNIRSLLYNVRAKYDKTPKYTVSRKYDLLRPLGLDGETPVLKAKFHINEKELKFAGDYFENNKLYDSLTVLFSPDSPREYKRWAGENYRDLGRLLIERYKARILILYGMKERQYCEVIKKQIGRYAMLLPRTDIHQAAAFVKKADLAVLNCGGIKHISVAVGTPSITIFGKTSSRDWHPPDIEWADFIQGEYTEGQNSFGISPELVMEKIDDFIKRGIVKIPG
jgi:ADP-heptose:LPS heptosyltransferase